MDLKSIKNGEKVCFEIGERKINSIYLGRFDFLYLFDTDIRILPQVSTIKNGSICIANLKLLEEYGFSVEEIRAILNHEVGHIISTAQKKLKNVDAEKDADQYAVTKSGTEVLLSALEKTKKVLIKEGTSKEKIENGINEIKVRCENIKKIERNKNAR